MKKILLSVILLPGLVAGCGRAEPGDGSYDAPRPEQGGALSAIEQPGAVGSGSETDPAAVEPSPAEGAAPAAPAAPPAAGAGSPPATERVPPAVIPPEQARPNDANEILRRVEQAYANVRSMEADFVQQLNVPLLGSNQRSEGKMFQRRPDRFLMRFSDPAGDIMVADGRYFWMYNPSVDRTQVLRTRMDEGGAQVDLQQQFLSNPTQRFVATLVGTETVNGRPAHLLSLVPRGASQFRLVRIWVDHEDSLVRRFELTEENESVRRVELRNVRLNVDLPDSLFQFSPPAGTQVFDN